jgi:transposase
MTSAQPRTSAASSTGCAWTCSAPSRPLSVWPETTQEQLAEATREELVEFARPGRHGWPERFADQVQAALAGSHFQTRPALLRAKADSIRLAARQLLLIAEQRKLWERRMGALLLGAPRRGRQHQTAERRAGEKVPGGEVYLSFPGLGDRLAARVAGEIGDHLEQFETPNSLQCYAGRAPVTCRSGKSDGTRVEARIRVR